MRPTYIVDIDGTLANIDHRLHYVRTEPKNWKAFELGYVFDDPNMAVVHIVHALFNSLQFNIVIMSGRMGTKQGRDDTIAWLEEHKIPYHALYMREDQDFRPDNEVKKDLLNQMYRDGYGKVLAVFDDRKRVVDMWREQGIFVFDCNQSGEEF